MNHLYRNSIVIDGTCPLANYEDYYKLWKKGGVTTIAPTVAVEDGLKTTITNIARWYDTIKKNDDLLLIRTVNDIKLAKQQGKMGIILHFQSSTPFEKNIHLISVYKQLGVRMVQLCYNERNLVGDGGSERTDSGLSIFGEKVIKEMESEGIVVDLSHTGYTTTMEAIELAKKPPVFSHSNVKAVCNSERNLTDDQIIAIAKKGGVIGLNGYPAFVAKKERPSVDDLLDHADYIVNLVGIDHVCLAIDYWEGMAEIVDIKQAQNFYDQLTSSGMWSEDTYPPPPWYFPKGIDTPDKLSNIADALQRRGYSENNIVKILGENWLRVFKQVWN